MHMWNNVCLVAHKLYTILLTFKTCTQVMDCKSGQIKSEFKSQVTKGALTVKTKIHETKKYTVVSGVRYVMSLFV